MNKNDKDDVVATVVAGAKRFEYTEQRWKQVLHVTLYFRVRTNFTQLTHEDEKNDIVLPDLVSEKAYAILDLFITSGGDLSEITRGNVAEILLAADFLQIAGVDEKIAALLDKGLFYPNARKIARLVDSNETDDNSFVALARLLWTTAIVAPSTKRACLDALLFWGIADGLYASLPKMAIDYALSSEFRRFGLERDVYRMVITWYDANLHGVARFEEFYKFLKGFCIEWPASPRYRGNSILFQNVKTRVLKIAETLAEKDDFQTFLLADHFKSCIQDERLVLGRTNPPPTCNEETFSSARSAASDFLRDIRTFAVKERVASVSSEFRLRKRSRTAASSCLLQKGGELYEFHPYVNDFRSLAPAPDLPRVNASDYLMVSLDSRGVWLLCTKPFDSIEGQYQNGAGSYLPLWFINFSNLSGDSGGNGLTNRYRWGRDKEWSLSFQLGVSNDDPIAVVLSNGYHECGPIVCTGTGVDFEDEYDTRRRWSAHLLGFDKIFACFSAPMSTELRMAHHVRDDGRTLVVYTTKSRDAMERVCIVQSTFVLPQDSAMDTHVLGSQTQKKLPRDLPASFLSRPGCSTHNLSLFCAPNGNPLMLSAGVCNASKTGFVIHGAIFTDGEWLMFKNELRDDRLRQRVNFDTLLSGFRGTTYEDKIVIVTAKILPYQNTFEGRHVYFDYQNRTFQFVELLSPAAVTRDTVCLTDGASVPSSRLGFWIENPRDESAGTKEMFRKDCDVIDWENYRL